MNDTKKMSSQSQRVRMVGNLKYITRKENNIEIIGSHKTVIIII